MPGKGMSTASAPFDFFFLFWGVTQNRFILELYLSVGIFVADLNGKKTRSFCAPVSRSHTSCLTGWNKMMMLDGCSSQKRHQKSKLQSKYQALLEEINKDAEIYVRSHSRFGGADMNNIP